MPLCLLLVSLAACDAGPAIVKPGDHYVAMGSSFAAGPGIAPPAKGSPRRCARSANNYAHLLAKRLALDLTDVTCSGAKTGHILGPWKELPAQLDAVTADTRLVTLTIGGNDLGYIGGLIAASCEQLLVAGEQQGRCFKVPAPQEEDFEGVAQRMEEIGRAIQHRAPKATIVYVTYFTVLPDDEPCASTPLTQNQLRTFKQIGDRLETITVAAAKTVSAAVVNARALTRNHHACAQEPWMTGYWANPDWSKEAPYHAAQQAMDAAALALADMLMPS